MAAVRPAHHHPRDLELDEDMAFQRRDWRLQRLGTLALIAFVLVALAGVFGSGPLSHATAEVPGLMRVEYQRLARFETSESVTIRLAPAVTGRREVRVSMDREYLDRSKMESVVPPPLRVEAAGDRLVYVFPVAEAGQPLVLTFQLQPERLGLARASVGVDRPDGSRTSVAFRQLVWP